MDTNTLLSAIYRGELDADLPEIMAALRGRQADTLNVGLVIGATVRFNSLTTPKYMVGMTAIVTKINGKTIKVTLTEESQRRLPYNARFGGGTINVSKQLVEVV